MKKKIVTWQNLKPDMKIYHEIFKGICIVDNVFDDRVVTHLQDGYKSVSMIITKSEYELCCDVVDLPAKDNLNPFRDKEWNSKNCRLAMDRLVNMAEYQKVNVDLSHPYLDKLSHQTSSGRIMKMIEEAYYLGMAKGILSVDEGMTPITFSKI